MSKATRDFQWKDKDDADRRSLLQVALDVHMDVTGSCDRASAEHDSDVRLLKLAIETWEPSSFARHRPFDDAVKALIRRALDEARP